MDIVSRKNGTGRRETVLQRQTPVQCVASKPSWEKAQVNERSGSGTFQAAGNAPGSGPWREPEPLRNPAGIKVDPKAARFGQGGAPGSHTPPESRQAPKAVAVTQSKGEVAQNLSLIREQPLARPELALREAFQLLELEDW